MALSDHKEFEERWNNDWEQNDIYSTSDISKQKKFYCLDMFPYPSGAGLHVGHPIGYIATDILCRFKRLQGYNVLHAMGFDSFGLPAEQYAIETGQHPAITTDININNFTNQLRRMGLSLDKQREFRTSEKAYYRWTQWVFIELFNSWYDQEEGKAKSIASLVEYFEYNGSSGIDAAKDNDATEFTAAEWNELSEIEQSDILMQYRLAYLSYATVNWCPQLGTVLANDEVIDGLSERGGYPVERRKMKQWMMRITAYADRLLNNLEHLQWSDSLKEIQRNWIGRSEGAIINFKVKDNKQHIEIFTTRPETLFGVTFICISPGHKHIQTLIKNENREEIESFISKNEILSELEKISDINNVNGIFTGSYAVHPITGKSIPIWIADYVLANYASGAIMAVPGSDERDKRFADKYALDILHVMNSESDEIINSYFLNGNDAVRAREKMFDYIKTNGIGKKQTIYKIRDAVFGRQRYWGEPIPIYYDENNIPKALPLTELPLELPNVDTYLPTADGRPPLARAKEWLYKGKYNYELTTMPGWAGSSWYFLRYMSPASDNVFVEKDAATYWNSVDFYMGGSEHATGHLLYSRFWNLFLYDLNHIDFEEPFKRIVNQGMILGRSSFAYRIKGTNTFVSSNLKDKYDTQRLHVDVRYINKDDTLNISAFKSWRSDYSQSEFIMEGDKFYCDWQIEKMSKSKYNTITPDEIIDKYSADTFRLYEMFLGPIQQPKPWNLNGIEGINKFFNKLWKLFIDNNGNIQVNDDAPTEEELQILHRMMSKVSDDIERLSFNTAITAFMICVNELTKLECYKREILEKLIVALSPFAVYTSQEIWTNSLFNSGYVINQKYPEINEEYLQNSKIEYPVMVNGKVRARLLFDVSTDADEIKKKVFSHPAIQKWTKSTSVKRYIFVPGKIINIVV
ncbi:leucine--tRNA ligase [Xenorhabdus sp. TH1]|uniref:leucine--tRNA ligase n=1 Tax=Xenorhabdus sp. TH1 TaxID=3130166 RepID=UPI0030D1C12C